MRELSIFIDELGDFGPYEKHVPFYILSVVLRDQCYDIASHLVKIHDALVMRGLPADHALHTAPLIRREAECKWMGCLPAAPSSESLSTSCRALRRRLP